MGRHRAPRRRGHPPPQPPPAGEGPHTNPELTPPPWLRVVPTGEDVLADPPADPVHVLPAKPYVTVGYGGDAARTIKVPIEDGMVIELTCVDGAPRIAVATR